MSIGAVRVRIGPEERPMGVDALRSLLSQGSNDASANSIRASR